MLLKEEWFTSLHSSAYDLVQIKSWHNNWISDIILEYKQKKAVFPHRLYIKLRKEYFQKKENFYIVATLTTKNKTHEQKTMLFLEEMEQIALQRSKHRLLYAIENKRYASIRLQTTNGLFNKTIKYTYHPKTYFTFLTFWGIKEIFS